MAIVLNTNFMRISGLIIFGMALFASSAEVSGQEATSKPWVLPEINRLIDNAEYPKALEYLSGIGSAYMNDPVYFLALGRAHLGAANYKLASAAFITAIAKKPDSAEAHFWLAYVRMLQKNFKGALESIDRAAKLDPADARIAYARCLIQMLSVEIDKATTINDLEKAVADFKKAKTEWEKASANQDGLISDPDGKTTKAPGADANPGDAAGKNAHMQQLNQVLADIENKCKPQIEAIVAKMKDLSGQGEKLQAPPAKDTPKSSVLEAKDKPSQTPMPPEIVRLALRTLPQPTAAASQPASTVEKIKKPADQPGNEGGISFMGLEGKAATFVFVIDKSGSMGAGNKFNTLRNELLNSIDQLQGTQTFHVIFYDTNVAEKPPKQLVAANNENKTAASTFLQNITPGGGTNPVPALKRAFKILKDAKGDKVIYLLSDGEFFNNEEILNAIKDRNPAVENQIVINTIFYNIQPLATQILEKIAKENKGQYKFVNPNRD
ncbi:MAG: VWA domain-containing protein [Planctomycetes bacterium]|nr:VWA domain-containing protein [Planctomycetota bacterium]